MAKRKFNGVPRGRFRNPLAMEFPALPQDESVKTCLRCASEKPNDAEYFNPSKDNPEVLDDWCADCRVREMRARQKRRIYRRIAELDAKVTANLGQFISRGGKIPHQSDLISQLTEAYGGIPGLVEHHVANCLAAKPGSPVRERMLGQVLKGISQVTEAGGAEKPLELLTDEELQARVQEHERKMLLTVVEAQKRRGELEQQLLEHQDG